jgi:hypothetical protein
VSFWRVVMVLRPTRPERQLWRWIACAVERRRIADGDEQALRAQSAESRHAVRLRMSANSVEPSLGCIARIIAAMPAMKGAAALVPVCVGVVEAPSGIAGMSVGAQMSTDAPKLEYALALALLSMAPTPITYGNVQG